MWKARPVGNRVRSRLSIGGGAFHASYRQGVDVEGVAGARPVWDASQFPLTRCRKSWGQATSRGGFDQTLPDATQPPVVNRSLRVVRVAKRSKRPCGVAWPKARLRARLDASRCDSATGCEAVAEGGPCCEAVEATAVAPARWLGPTDLASDAYGFGLTSSPSFRALSVARGPRAIWAPSAAPSISTSRPEIRPSVTLLNTALPSRIR